METVKIDLLKKVKNPLEEARQLAGSILKSHAPNRLEPATPVSLRVLHKIAKSLNTTVTYYDKKNAPEFLGTLWTISSEQPDLFGEYEAAINTVGYGSRFVLAHELAHRVAMLFVGKREFDEWSEVQRRRFLDEFASRLILPNEVLINSVGQEKSSIALSIDWLDQAHRKLGVSLSCLLKRLNDAERERLIKLQNCSFTCFPSLSLQQRKNFALRTFSVCTPSRLFLPSNKRLSSIGLVNLDKLYWSEQGFRSGVVEDRIMFAIHHEVWKQLNVECLVKYRIFPSDRPDTRCLIAVFDAPAMDSN
ncbi:MAG TPA: ImmA/IrrE family metallo-endopeptidase [candidate division Zixibacteria bacterium]|nr:ImmA/IrrE family metallo-endopeptidase [candidate division Zixibacteria bacterium]